MACATMVALKIFGLVGRMNEQKRTAGGSIASFASFASFVSFILLIAVGCNDGSGASGMDSGPDTDTDSDTDADTDAGEDAGGDSGVPMTPGDYGDPTPLEWAQIDGGTYLQGSEDMSWPANYDETPAHEVTVPTFEMMKTEVTTSQARTGVPERRILVCPIPPPGHEFPGYEALQARRAVTLRRHRSGLPRSTPGTGL